MTFIPRQKDIWWRASHHVNWLLTVLALSFSQSNSTTVQCLGQHLMTSTCREIATIFYHYRNRSLRPLKRILVNTETDPWLRMSRCVLCSPEKKDQGQSSLWGLIFRIVVMRPEISTILGQTSPRIACKLMPYCKLFLVRVRARENSSWTYLKLSTIKSPRIMAAQKIFQGLRISNSINRAHLPDGRNINARKKPTAPVSWPPRCCFSVGCSTHWT
jgi:hypothetical protein